METYMTIKDVSEYLKFNELSIRRWVHDREIPFCKIKRQIRFRLSDIEKWIADGGIIKAAVTTGHTESEITECDLFEVEGNSEVVL